MKNVKKKKKKKKAFTSAFTSQLFPVIEMNEIADTPLCNVEN
jgi:hypothetical protein